MLKLNFLMNRLVWHNFVINKLMKREGDENENINPKKDENQTKKGFEGSWQKDAPDVWRNQQENR